jgi:hypothetical protein
MSDRAGDPAVAQIKHNLEDARRQLLSVLAAVGDRWETPVYSEGAAWNVRQLLIHLAVSDQGQTNTVIAITEGRDTIPADFDLERFNRRSVEKRPDMTPDQAQQSLIESRVSLHRWLDAIGDASILEREGRHGSLRVLSARRILEVMADHERGHAADIARALGIAL